MSSSGAGSKKQQKLEGGAARGRRPKVIRPPKEKGTVEGTGGVGPSDFFSDAAGELLSVGHQPVRVLSESERELLSRFERNLVSLISHELRTPLIGLMNGLALLEEQLGSLLDGNAVLEGQPLSLLKRSAERLSNAMATLHDIAAIESGGLKVRLEEIDLPRLVEEQFQGLPLRNSIPRDSHRILLADGARLKSAMELCISSMEERLGVSRSALEVLLAGGQSEIILTLQCRLLPGMESALASWRQAWSAARAAFQGGLLAPGSAFSGVFADEREFLARPDGVSLGAEWVISHSILASHGAKMEFYEVGDVLRLDFKFPAIESALAQRALIESRLSRVGPALGAPRGVVLGYHPNWDRSRWQQELGEGSSLGGLLSNSMFIPVGGRVGLLWVSDLMGESNQLRVSLSEEVTWVLLPEDGLSADQGLSKVLPVTL